MLRTPTEVAKVATLIALRAYPDSSQLRKELNEGKKFHIDTWVGDAFAYVVGELRFSEKEISEARAKLFVD